MALALAAQGHQVIASARNEESLLSLEKLNPSIIALPCDITDETSMNSVQSRISSNFAGLDQVILNAGNCEYLEFPDPDWTAIRRVMEVNYFDKRLIDGYLQADLPTPDDVVLFAAFVVHEAEAGLIPVNPVLGNGIADPHLPAAWRAVAFFPLFQVLEPQCEAAVAAPLSLPATGVSVSVCSIEYSLVPTMPEIS